MTVTSVLDLVVEQNHKSNPVLGRGEHVHQFIIDIGTDTYEEAILATGIDRRTCGLDFAADKVVVTVAWLEGHEPRFTAVSASGPILGDRENVGVRSFKYKPSANVLGDVPTWLRDVVFEHVPNDLLVRFPEAS